MQTNDPYNLTNKSRPLFPVTKWPYPYPSIGSWRNLIFNRKTNGLDQFNVIKKVGKRVLVDEAAFFAWVDGQQGGK